MYQHRGFKDFTAKGNSLGCFCDSCILIGIIQHFSLKVEPIMHVQKE